MNKLRLSIPLALGSLFIATGACSAAETAPVTPPADKNASVTDLENRIKALEGEIRDLKGQLDERSTRNNSQNMQQFRNRMKRDLSDNFDDMFDQMRREMEESFGGGFNFGPNGQLPPPVFNGPGGPGMGGQFNFGIPAEKPRLGVQLAPSNEQLRERFKNDVKQGAFVIAVVPDSPAEKAGILVGDAITKVAGKDVANPEAAIEAIRNAPSGKTDLTIMRQNKEMTLKPDLAIEEQPTSADENDFGPSTGQNGGWLRRGDMNRGNSGKRGTAFNAPAPNGNMQMRTELKASALEVNDELAKAMKLTDDQRKKMSEVLQKHSQAASDEASAQSSPRLNTRGGMRGFSLSAGGDVSRIVDKHVSEAENELKGVLSDEQIREWQDYRHLHNSVQFSHSMTIESGTADEPAQKGSQGF
jgi:membrane-associated protease RseP (regulator of RpoE activity)